MFWDGRTEEGVMRETKNETRGTTSILHPSPPSSLPLPLPLFSPNPPSPPLLVFLFSFFSFLLSLHCSFQLFSILPRIRNLRKVQRKKEEEEKRKEEENGEQEEGEDDKDPETQPRPRREKADTTTQPWL